MCVLLQCLEDTMNTLDDSLLSLEKRDRTSPKLWSEQSMVYDKKNSSWETDIADRIVGFLNGCMQMLG